MPESKALKRAIDIISAAQKTGSKTVDFSSGDEHVELDGELQLNKEDQSNVFRELARLVREGKHNKITDLPITETVPFYKWDRLLVYILLD